MTRTLASALLFSALLLAACGGSENSNVKDGGKRAEPEEPVQLPDTAIAFVMATGEWRILLVNQDNSRYLALRRGPAGEELPNSPRQFDRHLRQLHAQADLKIIANRDMQAFAAEIRKAGFFDHAEEITEPDLLGNRWPGRDALVYEEAGKLWRLSKVAKQGAEMTPAELTPHKCYVAVKRALIGLSSAHRHYEVRGNVSPEALQPKEPLVKEKYKKQFEEQEKKDEKK